MIVKFLKRGTGSCKSTMDYLLGKNSDREKSAILKGDPHITQLLADSLPFDHRYTVGVLSFAEQDLPHETKEEIMAEFERTLMAGLEADQYNITWIEHRDKNRLELNFVIPKVELDTGKAINPYYAQADKRRVNAFKDYVNAHYDLHDPNDPANKQILLQVGDLPRDKKQLQEAITGYLRQGIVDGAIKYRQDVLNALESDLGLSVVRTTPNSISIKDPTNENGRNIRLKGEIYAETFRFDRDYPAENQRASQEYRGSREQRAIEARTILEGEISRKREFNRERYPRLQQGDREKTQTAWQQEKNNTGSHRGGTGIVDYRHNRLGGNDMANQQQKGGISRNRAENRANPIGSKSIIESGNQQKSRRQFMDNSQEQEKNESGKYYGRLPSNANGELSDDEERIYRAITGITNQLANTEREIEHRKHLLKTTLGRIGGEIRRIGGVVQGFEQPKQPEPKIAPEQTQHKIKSQGMDR